MLPGTTPHRASRPSIFVTMLHFVGFEIRIFSDLIPDLAFINVPIVKIQDIR